MNIHEFAKLSDVESVRRELACGTPVDSRDEDDYTPLAYAAISSVADESMLRALIDSGADVNAVVGKRKKVILGLAACSGSLAKVQLLADAGANVRYKTEKGYTILIDVVYALFDNVSLVPMIELLVELGVETDCETSYGESALSVSSRFGHFSVIKSLLDAGADPSPLQWSELMKAVALGTIDAVEKLLTKKDIRLDERDRWERTPWLLACIAEDIDKAKLMYEAGADLTDQERTGSAALAIAASRGNAELVCWLLEVGVDVEAVDNAKNTALMLAAQEGETDCVRLLLQAGAISSRTNKYGHSAMSAASSDGVMRLLIENGEDVSEINVQLKRSLLGLQRIETLNVTVEEYWSGCRPRYGKSNPQVMDVPFWYEMVRAGISAYGAKAQFDDADNQSEATWCFDRYGVSFTELPDGRYVQIGGEHEDFYDPDFCIYNEVLVHDRSGQFQILGYPKNVFPPTDFHSATYFEGFIYVVGGLGYQGTRQFGFTPIYRLSCQTWSFESVKSVGENPGWIYKHKARIIDSGRLVVSGGKVCVEVNGQEQNVDNSNEFTLDLSSGIWNRNSSR